MAGPFRRSASWVPLVVQRGGTRTEDSSGSGYEVGVGVTDMSTSSLLVYFCFVTLHFYDLDRASLGKDRIECTQSLTNPSQSARHRTRSPRVQRRCQAVEEEGNFNAKG